MEADHGRVQGARGAGRGAVCCPGLAGAELEVAVALEGDVVLDGELSGIFEVRGAEGEVAEDEGFGPVTVAELPVEVAARDVEEVLAAGDPEAVAVGVDGVAAVDGGARLGWGGVVLRGCGEGGEEESGC